MIISELFEAPQQCPECGGISFSNLILAEKKDACYHKVKASAKVWPSAYASGRLVQCRKKGAANYGNKSESVAEGMKAQDLAMYCEKLVAEKGWDAAYKHALMMANVGRDPAWNGVLKYLDAMKDGVAEGSLKEFAPVGGDDREPNEEEILRQLAAQWWNGTEQQMAKAQRTLAAMGWEIGPDESGTDEQKSHASTQIAHPVGGIGGLAHATQDQQSKGHDGKTTKLQQGAHPNIRNAAPTQSRAVVVGAKPNQGTKRCKQQRQGNHDGHQGGRYFELHDHDAVEGTNQHGQSHAYRNLKKR